MLPKRLYRISYCRFGNFRQRKCWQGIRPSNHKASAKEFKPFFNVHISKEAKVIADQWKGYLPLKKEYPLLKQVPSNKGANFKELHIHIMNIQGWLRGIHHHYTKERLQGYIDEYHYRYNRRSNMGSIFDLTIRRMICNKPIRLNNKKLKNSDLNAYTNLFLFI